MRRPIRIPMRFKMMVVLLLIVTAVVSAISFTMAHLFHADKSKYISDLSALVAHHAAEEATVVLDGYRRRLESYGLVATDMSLGGASKQTLLRKLAEDIPELVLLAIHEDGIRLGALYDNARLDAAGLQKRDLEAFLEERPLRLERLKRGQVIVENATVTPRLPALRMAVVLTGVPAARTVVVEAVIGLNELAAVGMRSRVFDVSLVDRQGVTISDRILERVARRERPKGLPVVNSRTLAEAREFDFHGERVIGGFSRTRVGNLTAVAVVPKSVALFASQELLGHLTNVSLLLLALTAVAGLIWSRTLTRPIARLVEAAGEIARGRFDVSVRATSSDEIGTLSEAFNRMATELRTREQALQEAQAQLIHSEKMAAFGQLGAGFAHEIKNPLAGILGLTQVFQRQVEAGTPVHDGLGMMEKETKRCKAIIDNLLKFARQEKVLHEPTDMARVVEDAAAILRHQLAIHQVELDIQAAPDLPAVMGNANQLQQVLMNLMINARQALEGRSDGRVEVSAERSGDRHIAIRVRDNGPGIPKEIQQRIFEPFFTTKPAGEGTGLGLSVSFGIVRDHHGTISVDSAGASGTTFQILLPITDAAAVPPPGLDATLPRAA